jgi:branched-subunit amino acid transport protein
MNFTGLIIGIATFLIIGLFHPIVIKAEYYLGTKCWWMFALAGIIFIVLSILIENIILSTILGVFGFSSFWSILELFEQKKRVEKGWFPKNPKRK